MTLVQAKVIEDSVYNGVRLTSVEVEYPRYIHAEVMTHRVFSRNFQSSRAIPLSRMIELVSNDNWYPLFMENKPGMAATNNLTNHELSEAKKAWDKAKREALMSARWMGSVGVHKQVVNRLLEPFSKIKGLITATEWDNFFSLRLAGDAQQEIQLLARSIKDAMESSTPTHLDISEWHLPYVRFEERDLELPIKRKLSAARCARVSYLNHNGENSLEDNSRLHDQLIESRHMSPLEHQATPSVYSDKFYNNFRGFIQYRKYIEDTL